MERIQFDDILPSSLKGGVLTIGKFDGVHRGHAEILSRLKGIAQKKGVPAIVFTFDPFPSTVIRPHLAPPLLCSLDRRIELIQEFDPDAVLLFHPTREFLALTPKFFFEIFICRELGVSHLVEGSNFNFGNNRAGDVDLLARLCKEKGIGLDVVEPVHWDGHDISSSRIRALLREGNLDDVNTLLNRPYRLSGQVVHGDERGRLLGYPTANLESEHILLPKDGLYAARVDLGGVSWKAAVNLGGNPTFGVEQTKIEVHLLDFDGDLYGRTLNVDLEKRIRDVRRFDSKDDLLEQMKNDIASVRSLR